LPHPTVDTHREGNGRTRRIDIIEHVPKIIDMRRHLVLNESRFPTELKATFRNLETNGNPWQLSASTRAELSQM
jgi:hypothetical protein